MRQGSLADLAGYQLDDATKASTPYYVSVAVKNVGSGDVGGSPIPLYLADSETPPLLINSSSFNNSFKTCPSQALPASFAAGASASTCLVYLAPNHGTMSAISFRPLMKFAPILWTGVVEPPLPATKKKSS